MEDRLLALLDKQDIQATLMRFARGIDQRDATLIRSAFHPDATDDHGPFKGSIDEFVLWAMPILQTFNISQHEISNIQIDLHGHRANVETYLLALHIVGTPPVEETVFGRYLDMFEKRDGEWKISKRLVVVDYSSTRDCDA